MSEPRFKLSPPWIIYVAKLEAMFGNDPEIEIEYDNDIPEVTLRVENPAKAEAIEKLLPVEEFFGDVCLEITVIPANDTYGRERYFPRYPLPEEIFNVAFKNNPIYAYSVTIEGMFSNPITYVVFKNRVVQFFADNLSDPHGNISTLYQDIADEIFKEADVHGVSYCTDIEEKVGKPLGEWP